jgi:4,5-dihydroxyphthalate decarboxylase
MPKVSITFACGLYDRMLALYTGEVKPDGIDLNFLAIDDPRQIFDRMGKNLEFDACEMSSSEVISRQAALASEASGQRGNSVMRAHSASEDARKRADDTRPEPGSSARAALASEASGQRGNSVMRAPDTRPEPGSSARAAARNEMVALPVFPSRVFRHGFITVNRKAVRTPKDLEGKRIGVPLYTQTAALFIRGLLQDEYGVDLSGVHWVQGATNNAESHGNPAAPPLLKPVSIEQNKSGRSLSELLERGEIQAILGSGLPVALKTNPDVQRLFPDFHARELDYFKRTRIFPIMHLVAIRRDIYERHPFIATSLYKAMTEAKDIALAKMRDLGALRYMLPGMTAELDVIDDVFAGDPWPYGVDANRPTLEALVRYLTEQSLIKAPIPVDDLFVPIYGQ